MENVCKDHEVIVRNSVLSMQTHLKSVGFSVQLYEPIFYITQFRILVNIVLLKEYSNLTIRVCEMLFNFRKHYHLAKLKNFVQKT